MSRPKRGDKKSKEATADREDETCFTDDRADTSRKTGHGKLPGATGGEGTSGSTEVVGTDEADQAKKKSGPFKRIRKSISKVASRSSKSSSKDVQSPTSPISLDDSLRQSEETEELPAKESLGPSTPVRKPSTISSCDSQASGGPVSPNTEQMRSIGESRIRELEEKLLNSEDTSSRLEEEVQRKEQEYEQALVELEKKQAATLAEKNEGFRKLQQQQKATNEEQLEKREKQHKVEVEQIQKQHEAELDKKEKVLRALFLKQLREKDAARASETKELQEELAQEKRFSEEQQLVRNSQIKVAQTQELQLQKLQEKMTEKDEEWQLKLREKETQVQRFVQKADKQLQECQTQLQQEQEGHAQEKKQMTENYEAQLQEATKQHTAEKERLLGEKELLQQEQKRSLEEMADKRRQYEEQQQKDILQQSAQETDQMTKGHETQMEQLKLQHKRALEEKDRQLTESRSRLQERYDKDMTKRTREFQAKLVDAERRHKTQLEDKQKQYDISVADVHKRQHDALQMQVAQMKRSHEKELQGKEEENARKVEQEIQRREQVLREELQQREQALQELQQRNQMLQQREQELQQQDTQLGRYEQQVIEKDAKIAQLESDLSGMIPSSGIPPSEESPSGSKDQSATSHRVPVQSRNEIVADLHSNVVDMAREISYYVDPENVLPSVQCCHHLNPTEVKRIFEVLGGQAQLQEHKPQNYCFAVLPANNQRQSVLFDYTGTFRPSPDDEVCPLRAQEEDRFHTPPSTPTTEVPRMLAQDADVAANLPDSEKVKRLKKALDGHIRLHADMEEEMRSKTDEVERGQNEIADLRKEMDARDEELRIQGKEIRVLKESLREKEQEIEEKLQSIEDFHTKVEQRDRQLDYLKKRPNEAELSPKALEEYDLHFDHVLKLTEELTDSEATVKKQQREIDNHKKLVERAERMEEQVTLGAVELSEKEQEIKELAKQIQHIVRSAGIELEDEVDRFQPFEHNAKELKAQLTKVEDHLHEQGMVQHQLQQKVESLSGAKLQLEERLQNEQERVSELNSQLEETRHELEKLKEEYGKLELQLRQGGDARQMKKELPELENLRALEEKLQDRDEELRLLRRQATGSAVPSPASLKYDDLPPGTDPKVEIATLKQALETKDQKIQSLQVQVGSFERVIQEQQKLHGHTKEQSKQVLKLRQELEAVKKEKETLGKTPSQGKMEDQTGVDLRLQLEQLEEKLAIAKDENRKLEEERDSAKSQVDLLHGDLGVTQVESTKEEKKWETERVTLRLQLETLRSEKDKLQQQVEWKEAIVGRLETDLNITKARCAELDGGMIQLQTVLSESELNRQKIHQELVKVKHQRDQHEQTYISLLSVHENLKSQASQMECVQHEISQVKREASQWKEKLSGLNTALSKLKDEVEPLRRQNNDLRGEVEALRKENDDLKGEIEARKFAADVWKEDFQKERDDRQQAAGRVDNERAEVSVQCQHLRDELQTCHTRIRQFESENKRLRDEIRVHEQVMTDYDAMQLQLVQHKEQVANMEQVFQAQQQEYKAQLEQANRLQRTQLEDVHRQLRKANQQLDQAVTDNEKLNDDVLAKTQQVKQYKKQVDGLKAEVAKYKSQKPATMEELDMQTAIAASKQTETARQLEEVTRNLQDATRRSEELREERDALRSEVEQLKSEKMNQLHFSAAFQKEFEKRGEFQEKYKKEFEMRGEFESKYHQVMDRCAELFEQVQQLRGVLEHHQIKIPDPPPRQRAPPADVPRAVMQQPQGLMSRSSEGDMHPPAYHGDPAAHHTSPRLARPDPRSANVPPEVRPHPSQQYEFRQPPTPIQPLPQQGVDQIYEPREQAWVRDQPYNPGEQAPDMMYQAPGHVPQHHVRDQPHHEAHYSEGMRRENEEITQNIAEKLQIQHEHEKIEALMAQRRAQHHPEQDRQFHPEHEMAHQQHHGHMRQGYSVDDPRYAPVQHQDGVGPSGHSSLPTSSITAPQLGGDRPHPHHHVSPSDPYYVPGIAQCGDLAMPHHMHGLQHPNEVDPQVVASRQQLENVRFQKHIKQQQILQAQEQMRAQQQMVHMEGQQPVQGYSSQGYQGYHHMEDYLQMQGHPQMQPGMVVPQHQLGAYHGQQPAASPRLYGDSTLPQSHPRRPMPAQNVPQQTVPRLLPYDQEIAGQNQQQPVSPYYPPGSDQGQYPAGMQPAVSPRHPPPGSDQGHVPDQYAMGMQPRVTPSTDQPPQEQYPQGQYPQGDPITPTEEANPDHAAKISKPVEESCPDRPEQRQKQPSAQQDENKLMKGLDTEIHDTAADVEANVQSKEELESLQGAPMDPNLECPMCGHGYRVGEIQKYRRHVKSCHGST